MAALIACERSRACRKIDRDTFTPYVEATAMWSKVTAESPKRATSPLSWRN